MNTFEEEYQRKVAEGLIEGVAISKTVEATRIVNEGVIEGPQPEPQTQPEPQLEGTVSLPLPEPTQQPLRSGLSESELKAQGIPTYYGRLVQQLKGQRVTRDFPPCHAVEYKEYKDGSGVEITLIGTKYSFILDKPGDIFYCMVKEGTGWKNANVKSYDRYREECERERKKGKKRKIEGNKGDDNERSDQEETIPSKLKSVKRRA